MLNSEEKKNILTLVLSEKEFLNETKKNNPPPPLHVKWSVPYWLAIFPAISWREQVNFQWDDDEVRFVLDQHA